LKPVREKKTSNLQRETQQTCSRLLNETFKARRACSEVLQALNESNFNPRIPYPAKLSFKIDGAIKVFHDKQKLKQYMTTKTLLQRFFKEFCTQKVKANKTMKGQAVTNHRRRKGKKVESNKDLAACNQALKQLRQLNDRKYQIPINTNTEC
jgi:hypothetical protein